ncbi:hypothetical protein ACFVMC_02555 [Nocardia sp. NPDC127579]|uniref:hypothetical protein n=1 Tax=Nocardia sp. NPDC127579 TaxID=3345402 RepID=UPI0036369130
MITVLTAAVLASWLLVTVLVPMPLVGKVVGRALPACFAPLVPSWTFFAPRPAIDDRVLCYRDLLSNGEVSPLRAVWPDARPPGRTRKAVGDASAQLSTLLSAGPDANPSDAGRKVEIMVSPPYLLLLARCVAARHDVTAVGVQFVVVLTNLRGDPPRVVFTSAMHRLDGARP